MQNSKFKIFLILLLFAGNVTPQSQWNSKFKIQNSRFKIQN